MRRGLYEQWNLDITKGQGTGQISSLSRDFVIEVLSPITGVQNTVRFNVRYVEVRLYTAVLRKIVGKNVHATIPKGNMEYGQYTVPINTVAVKPTFISLKNSELKTTHNTFRGCRVHFIRQPFSK